MTSTQTNNTSTTDKTTEEQRNKNPHQKTAADPIDLEKTSLAHVTAKVADGPEAGVPAGQVANQGMLRADSDIAHAADPTKVRPSVIAAFREEIRSKVIELATAVETKIREITQQRQAPSQVAQENKRRDEDKARDQQQRDRELSLQW